MSTDVFGRCKDYAQTIREVCGGGGNLSVRISTSNPAACEVVIDGKSLSELGLLVQAVHISIDKHSAMPKVSLDIMPRNLDVQVENEGGQLVYYSTQRSGKTPAPASDGYDFRREQRQMVEEAKFQAEQERSLQEAMRQAKADMAGLPVEVEPEIVSGISLKAALIEADTPFAVDSFAAALHARAAEVGHPARQASPVARWRGGPTHHLQKGVIHVD